MQLRCKNLVKTCSEILNRTKKGKYVHEEIEKRISDTAPELVEILAEISHISNHEREDKGDI